MTSKMTWRPRGLDAQDYGFEWGPLTVIRAAHIDGRWYVVRVMTDHQMVDIYVSSKGRNVKAVKHAR